MHEHRNGQACIRQIVRTMKETGICTVEANAPMELLSAAYEEAEKLWKDGAFGPAWQVFDESSRVEAQLFNPAMPDEDKVIWLRGETHARSMTALKSLQKNMSDFSTGLIERLAQEMGVKYDCFWDAMVSCYTGDRRYDCHIDNPHRGNLGNYPDNGMRLTMLYYINPHWEPSSGDNGGGVDIFLTDPSKVPKSASEAKNAPKLRVAPHSDTLVLLLSERMAHQVVPTKGKKRWYCMTLWCFETKELDKAHQRFHDIRRRELAASDSDEASEVD